MNWWRVTEVVLGLSTGAVAVIGILWCECGCGGSWTPSDTTDATNIVKAQEVQLVLCSTDDGGTCRPSHVRALAEPTKCAAARMLYEHRQPIPDDAGGDCRR